MSKRYSVSLKVFSSICGVTVSIGATILSFALLFGAEHYQSLEISLIALSEVDLFYIEFYNNVAF
jgi:hypothetical protein